MAVSLKWHVLSIQYLTLNEGKNKYSMSRYTYEQFNELIQVAFAFLTVFVNLIKLLIYKVCWGFPLIHLPSSFGDFGVNIITFVIKQYSHFHILHCFFLSVSFKLFSHFQTDIAVVLNHVYISEFGRVLIGLRQAIYLKFLSSLGDSFILTTLYFGRDQIATAL